MTSEAMVQWDELSHQEQREVAAAMRHRYTRYVHASGPERRMVSVVSGTPNVVVVQADVAAFEVALAWAPELVLGELMADEQGAPDWARFVTKVTSGRNARYEQVMARHRGKAEDYATPEDMAQRRANRVREAYEAGVMLACRLAVQGLTVPREMRAEWGMDAEMDYGDVTLRSAAHAARTYYDDPVTSCWDKARVRTADVLRAYMLGMIMDRRSGELAMPDELVSWGAR